MSITKTILRAFIFRRNTSLYSTLNKKELLCEIYSVTKSDRFLGGQLKPLSNSEYSYYALISLSPSLTVVLKPTAIKEVSELEMEISLHFFTKTLLFGLLGVILMYVVLSSHLSFIPGSDGFFALIGIPIIYIVAQLSFWFGSESCKNEFARVIETIEKNNSED
ncbi:MAG: hypothetical protein AB8B53_06895 [Flavobacteriales bacterium]